MAIRVALHRMTKYLYGRPVTLSPQVPAGPPAGSPFLRRPDLLRSLVSAWVNHPSRIYLFSSIFIGPTSQAPRADESRADAVYELEIALGLLEDHSGFPAPPWLVDRIFRNLLVDLTGNTLRAEFRIDWLSSPDSASGRLGPLEMRAFEIPPHARMSPTQQLRALPLITWFRRQLGREAPVRWLTRLHDPFVLPQFAGDDLSAVLAELNRAGCPLEPAWFAPHFECRFPVPGRVCYAGVEMELRQAIEPWCVLGEEPGGGTRFPPIGPTPSPMPEPRPEPNPEFPLTLDLRRRPPGVD